MYYNFEELCLPCYQELVAFANKRTKCRATALDIVQQSVLRAFQAWGRWEPLGDPAVEARAWMFRIVGNVFATHYQREKKLARITGRMSDSTDSTESTMVAASLHQEIVSEHPYSKPDSIGDEVRDAMERIRPEWADVVRLVYIEETPANEVAKILNIAPGTVRSRMARGRLALARILSPYARQRFGFSVRGGADEAALPVEPTQTPERETDRVQAIVAQHHG